MEVSIEDTFRKLSVSSTEYEDLESYFIDSDTEYLPNKNKCKNCYGALHHIQTEGEVVCTECGLVNEMVIDNKIERKFGDKDTSQCHMMLDGLLASTLSTTIEGVYTGLGKLQKWGNMTYNDRSKYKEYSKIQDGCERGEIKQKIQNGAKSIYNNISNCPREDNPKKKKINRGNNRKGIVASSVAISARDNEIPRTKKEISKMFNINEKDVTRGLKKANIMLNEGKMKCDTKLILPEQFLTRFCNDNNVDIKLTKKSLQMAKNIRKLNIASSHTPLSIASSSLLLVSDIYDGEYTKKTVAKMFDDISEVTIVKVYKKLEEYSDILLDDKKVDELLDD